MKIRKVVLNCFAKDFLASERVYNIYVPEFFNLKKETKPKPLKLSFCRFNNKQDQLKRLRQITLKSSVKTRNIYNIIFSY